MDKTKESDKSRKRFWKDRREYSYDKHMPERRHRERRSGMDRRQDQRSDTHTNTQAVS
jgi:hypothetical protein